jgi:NAD(P)-dependent dehydrogenase (short-subunit alcohol dehydrogenase family)
MQGPPQSGAYAATKQALRALADGFRFEMNPYGVRVLSVYPGKTASPMQAMLQASEGRSYDPSEFIQPEDIVAAVSGAIDLPRSAELTDLTIMPMARARIVASGSAELPGRPETGSHVEHREPISSAPAATDGGRPGPRIRRVDDPPRALHERLRS